MKFLDIAGLQYYTSKILLLINDVVSRINNLTASDVGAATPSYVDEQVAKITEVGVPKLNVYTLEQAATTEGQTTFPINLDTFDSSTDTVLVQSGRTMLSPVSDFTVSGKNVVLTEGVPLGRTITIYVFKNVPAGEDGSVSGSVIADGSIAASKLAETYLPIAGGTMTGELRVNGSDVVGGSKIVLVNGKGQITASGTQTLFGFTADSTIAVGHSSFILAMRGSGARPKYNSKDIALTSDIPAAPSTETWTFTLEDGSTVTKAVHVG